MFAKVAKGVFWMSGQTDKMQSDSLFGRLLRMKMWLCGIGIILFAVLVILGSQNTKDDFWKTFMETIGIGLLPVGSFILIYEYNTRRDYQELVRKEFQESLKEIAQRCGECEKYGLTSISDKRDPEILEQAFRQAKNEETISVLGVALADLTDFERYRDVKSAIVEKGCKLRLLYLDPDSKEAEVHSGEENREKDEVRDDIISAQNKWSMLSRDLQERFPESLTIKKYKSIPKHFLLINSNGVYAGHYLRGIRGNEGPHFQLAKGGILAKQLIAHFEEIWRTGSLAFS